MITLPDERHIIKSDAFVLEATARRTGATSSGRSQPRDRSGEVVRAFVIDEGGIASRFEALDAGRHGAGSAFSDSWSLHCLNYDVWQGVADFVAPLRRIAHAAR